ncbi:MAG TPA: hypothetical protein VFQ23_02180 [Anaerolineales bacterium]|nr:hypothetical protein [Anaerolineales bacterium]
MNNSPNTGPRGPSPLLPFRGLSQRGLLSLLMLLLSIGGLMFALLGGARLILDIFSVGLLNSINGIATKLIVIGLAYAVGWLSAMFAIRVFGNLVLPFIINIFIWGCLIGVCSLYVLILQRLYVQAYGDLQFWAYLLTVVAGLGAMIGLHLIIEDHDLRPFSVPLLIINLIQLGLIVFRYVFTTGANPAYLLNDIFFFLAMSAFSIFMLVHIGLLAPIRAQLTQYFDKNSKALRNEN